MTAQPVCIALTTVLLAIALLAALLRRRRAATRWLALALLPMGLYLTGLIPVGRRIGHELRTWAQGLVPGPQVWTGFGLLGLALLLLLAARIAARRRAAARPPEPAPRAGETPRAVAAAPSRQEPAGRPAAKPTAKPAARTGGEDLGDFSEIEEILRRRGI